MKVKTNNYPHLLVNHLFLSTGTTKLIPVKLPKAMYKHAALLHVYKIVEDYVYGQLC